MRKLLAALFVMAACNGAMAQYSSSNKKATALFDQAISKYSAQEYPEAEALCDKCLKMDPKFVEPYLLKAEIYANEYKLDAEIECLKSADALKPNDATITVGLGDAYFEKDDYKSAMGYYRALLAMDRVPEKFQKKAHRNIELAEFRVSALANPVDISPRNLGPNVNTRYNDYFPALSADAKTMVYTIELPQTASNPLLPVVQEDIFITKRTEDGPWQQARSIGAIINTNNNEGAPFLSADGKILLFTSCTCPDGLIKCCDIYYSYNKNGEWTFPKALPEPVNSGSWESQPAFSADNRTLYFVSNRPGGFGGKDIWYCQLMGNGRWSEPVNAGENVNTPGDESSPFIHADNSTLYFASDGHLGMGGQDLFVSRLQDDGSWGKAVNLGYPINTKGNETRLAVSVFGSTAIISSDREEQHLLDLYEIDLPQSIRPKRTLLVQGQVFDSKTSDPIVSGYEVVDLASNSAIQKGSTEASFNNLMLYLPEGNDYALNVESPGYLMNSMNFSLKDIPDSVSIKRIELGLMKLQVGSTVTLENIFFDTDKYDIKPESYYELDKFADFMLKNPGIKVEVGGHTDNSGSESHNQLLSQNRAKAIRDYLVSHSVDPKRLTFKGYGSQKPCVENTTKENMAKNRRTEVKIIE